MNSQIYQTKASSNQLYLDPRTKMLLCLVVSTIVLAGNGDGLMLYLQYALTIIPFAFLLILKKYKVATYYFIMYLFCRFVPLYIMKFLPDIINVLFTGIVAFGVKIIPGAMMGYFLIKTTTVSEFVAAMDRIHMTKKLTIPFSILFRFFPTVIDEYRNVRDAMKLRGVGGLRNPMQMLEYRMVPFLMSTVLIGNELSASALTRGIDSPCKRVNVCPIGFTWRDYIAFVGIIISVVLFIIASI